MEVLEALRGRQSIKSYLPIPVEEEKLQAVLEAGRLAPSSYNSQCRKFLVVTDPALRKALHDRAGTQPMIEQAPVVIVICATPDQEHADAMPCGESKHPIDAALSGAYMMLEAYAQGLGTCWLGAFDAEAVKEVLGIPRDVKVVTMMPLGYHDGTQPRRDRKPLEELVSRNRF
ncbi:nitroreductase family protein [uncultured Oscillibacter sp.]|uniref:nitroreductase family protein n=1 Tax=uncultured Oscillibacter sp. TaxID=876091 RepID=UPI0028044EC8|nr:nitroreductase family protein [uncultured Oscillibacter sp.]